jgi:beta-mannan synthase
VELECENWVNKGVNIKYATRTSRKGFKAGALKKGMECDYARQSEYIAIFDADFQPEPDFLLRTVPFLVHNPEVALVQARWSFVNDTTSLLTRVQKMFFDYHFKVEQEAGSATFAFFSFNGTHLTRPSYPSPKRGKEPTEFQCQNHTIF